MAYRVDPYDSSIVIDGFQAGIAESPHAGFSDMRNCNIVSVPGEAAVNFSMSSLTLPTFTGTYVSSASNIITYTLTSGEIQTGQAVIFSNSGGALPTGITAARPYWVINLGGGTMTIWNDPDFNSQQTVSGGSGTTTFVSVDMGVPASRDHTITALAANTYIIDGNGRAWRNNTSYYQYLGNETNLGAGQGLVLYRGYLFVMRATAIDYSSTTFTNTSWTYGWAGLTLTSGGHQSLVGQDDTVYVCNASAVASFFQKSGQTFNPATSATYTASASALALPSIDTAQCLTELGTNLLVGGANNAIYPWNRTATSFTYPILISETNIQQIITVNTNTYILAGGRGRIYITNGSRAQMFKKVPDHISGTIEPYFTWGDLNANKNQLYFGVSAKSNSGTVLNFYGGVWAIDLDTEAIRLVNKLTYNTVGDITNKSTYAGIASVIISQPQPTFPGSGLLVGWDSGASTYGMDTSATSPYTSSQATIDSDLIPMGTFDKPKDLSRIEYKLSKPMVNGESISVYYRLDFSQSYTLIFTDTATSTYLPFSKSAPINFKNAQWVQFQIVLNSVASNPSYVRLKEIRLTGIPQQ